jgi:hypothetical protein
MVLFVGAANAPKVGGCKLATCKNALDATTLRSSRHLVRPHQTALGQVVLVYLLDVHRQGQHFCLAPLTQLIGVSWLTAQRMLRKLRVAMGDQNRLY